MHLTLSPHRRPDSQSSLERRLRRDSSGLEPHEKTKVWQVRSYLLSEVDKSCASLLLPRSGLSPPPQTTVSSADRPLLLDINPEHVSLAQNAVWWNLIQTSAKIPTMFFMSLIFNWALEAIRNIKHVWHHIIIIRIFRLSTIVTWYPLICLAPLVSWCAMKNKSAYFI